ncbi:MAG TPA: carboxymuconolactone decarboxylase family protein [bacterium]
MALAAEHPQHEPLILLSALSVLWLSPQDSQAVTLLQRYHARGFPREALRETALQLFLLAGFQASLEATFQIRDVLGDGLPAEEPELVRLDAPFWLERGKELQTSVYRENTSKLRENLTAASPELSVWTVLVGYGLVLSRPGLPSHWRELIEVALLVVQGFPRQLHSHLRGAVNLGATHAEVELMLSLASIFAPERQSASAWHMWRRIK